MTTAYEKALEEKPEEGQTAFVRQLDPTNPNYSTARATSDPEEVRRLYNEGADFIGAREAADLYKQELTPKPGGFESGVAGAVQTVTGGFGLPAIGALGEALRGKEWADADKQRNLMYERNPWYGVGQAAGLIVPALLTGGATGLGRLGGGALGATGGLTESLVARALPEMSGLLGGLARPAIGMAARGAAEGALLNMGEAATQAYNHSQPFTVEAMLAAGKGGALMGGVLGGGMGLAGAGLGKLGELVASKASASGEEAAARVFSNLGADKTQIGRLMSKEGGLVGQLEDVQNLIRKGEYDPKAINKLARESMAEHAETRLNVARELDKIDTTPIDGMLTRFKGRLGTEVMDEFRGTAVEANVRAMLRNVSETMSDVAVNGNGTPWLNLVKSRDQLTAQMRPFLDTMHDTAVHGEFSLNEVRHRVMNAFDSSLAEAMNGVSPELAAKYGAATLQKNMMRELELMTGNKVRQALVPEEDNLGLHRRDYLVAGAIGSYSPFGAAAGLASKSLSNRLQQAMDPISTKWAMSSALGSKAEATASGIKDKIRTAVEAFFKTAPAMGVAEAKPMQKKPAAKFSAKDAEDAMDHVRHLVSMQHQQDVQKSLQQLRDAGQGQLADAMAASNQRTVEYVKGVLPQSPKGKAHQNMAPVPKYKSPSMETLKAIQKMKGVFDPMRILSDMNDGSVSRDQMEGFRANYPELHAEIVNNVQERVMQSQQSGEFLPTDKIATLSLVLGVPLNNTMQPEYIQAVQASFAVADKPEPPQPATPSPVAESLQTPMEKSLS